jgi:hypothetical protein
MSIQLPVGLPGGVVNHVTNREAYVAALEVLEQTKDSLGVRLICHHKSEFIHFSGLFKGDPKVSVYFSSWFQDTWQCYRESGLVVSTRLHAVLGCRALGIPGIVVNSTDRHLAALEQFPGTSVLLDPHKIRREIARLTDPDHFQKWRASVVAHQEATWQKYTRILEPHVRHLKISQ